MKRDVTEYVCDTCKKSELTPHDRAPDEWYAVCWSGMAHCGPTLEHFCSEQCIETRFKS